MFDVLEKMKKENKMLKNIIKLILGIILIFGFIACGGGNDKKHIYKDVNMKSFKVEFLEYGKVKVTWDAVEGANSYQVRHYRPSLFLQASSLPFTLVNVPSIILDDLNEGKWFISVLSSNGQTWISPTIELTSNSVKINIGKITDSSEELNKITKKSISGKNFEITNIKYDTEPFVVTFNQDKTITNVLGFTEHPFSRQLNWEVSTTGELKTILKTYSGDEVLERFIHKQIGYENGCYLINTKQIDSSSWKNKYKLCPSSTDIKKIKKVVAVSGNYNEDDWNNDFELVSLAEVNEWGGGLIDEIPFYNKMIVDLGFFNGSKKDEIEHTNPSYLIFGNKTYLIVELLDKDNYLLHTFALLQSQDEKNTHIKFDEDIYNINNFKSQDILQGFIRIENNQLIFDGEYNMTKEKKSIFKIWNISDFKEVKKIHIDMGILHTTTDGISQIPIYINY